MSDSELQSDTDNTLKLLFEDRPRGPEVPKASCMSGVAGLMYAYYRSYLFPLMDFDFTYKDEWEILFDALSEMEYVGAGAFGKVYSAKLNGEVVAVKIPEDKKETDMLYLRELRHENIVRFRGVCTQGPTYCIVMEYCQYGSLYNFLHSGTRVSINRIFKWANEIAMAMAYLHSKNIIHRDLKSPNVLIADNLVCKVSDFGTSRQWEKFSLVMTTRGTTYWMAPELMLGKKCSDKVDVWSFGVVLWELLTQEVPYEDLHPCAVTYGVGRAKISLPLPATFPLQLRILLTHCWNRQPRCRPSFARISNVLALAGDQWGWLGDDLYGTMQDAWRQEVAMAKDKGWQTVPREEAMVEEQPRIQNKVLYKKIMREASKMYMDACALYLRLEQREVAIAEREMAYSVLPSRNWLNRRRNSNTSTTANSAPQLTIVKLHQSVNNRLRTVTKLSTTGSLPNEVTLPTWARKNRAAAAKSDLTRKSELTRLTDELVRQTGQLSLTAGPKTDDENGNVNKIVKKESVAISCNDSLNDNFMEEPVAV